MSEILGSRPVQGTHRASVLKTGLLFFLLGASRLLGQQGLNSIASEVKRVFDDAKKAVVRIQAEDDHGRLSGTGFFIDPTGTIMTAYAVGGESRDIIVEFGLSRYPARASGGRSQKWNCHPQSDRQYPLVADRQFR